jgi:hypothetical protein
MWLENIAVKKPVSRNFSKGGMVRPLHGLVLHIQVGYEAGTYAAFNKKGYGASSHFGNPKHGDLEQFVDTDDTAWAQVHGNRFWLSVENEGFPGDSLTPSQVANLAALLGWMHWNEDVPLQLANTPADYGLGYHAMGGASWGGHMDCPGKPILQQRLLVLERAGFWRPEPQAVSL